MGLFYENKMMKLEERSGSEKEMSSIVWCPVESINVLVVLRKVDFVM